MLIVVWAGQVMRNNDVICYSMAWNGMTWKGKDVMCSGG